MKNPLEITKRIVLSSITWAVYKENVSRNELNSFKRFISAIPTDDILDKIEKIYHCTNSLAQNLLNDFKKVVGNVIDGDTLNDEILSSAISMNSEFQKKAKALVRSEWEKENEHDLSKAQNNLDTLNAEINSVVTKLSEAKESLSKIQEEEKQLTDIIAKKQKLAEDVELAVAERIQKARENVADFIASMSFVGGKLNQSSVVEIPSVVEASFRSGKVQYRILSASDVDNNSLEDHHSWTDVINTAEIELGEAGVAERYSGILAAFLCAAYIEKQPILIVGPNAVDIAQAFSVAVSCHKYGTLCCDGSYDSQMIEKIGACGEKIVVINNLFTSGWVNRLPEILSQKHIFYIATHPFTEDIQVEPKSLYGFMLPFFTELFVDNRASGMYFGGYFTDDFSTDFVKKVEHRELKFLSKITLSSLVRKQINRLVDTVHCISPREIKTEEVFWFAILPIAYAILETNELMEVVDQQKEEIISASLKRDLRNVLGEKL